jgi:PAS domain S-box-containing protein
MATLRVEHALESMSDAFVLLDREFRITYMNPAAERTTGSRRQDVVGHSHWDVWPASVGTEPERRYRLAISTGESQHFQHQYVGEGYDIWLDIHAYPNPDSLAIYFRDITEHKREQTTRGRIERAYKAALSNTPDLVYVFDLDHRFLYANEALLTMWGRTWDDAIGKTCLELGYPDWHAAMHDREIEEVRATRRPITGEVPFTGTQGRRIYEYIFVPVLGTHGEVEAVAGTTRDVTERQKAEDALRQSEKLATAGRLASSIAHEINNPLEAVTNLLYLIAGDDTLAPDTRHLLDVAQSELVRVSHITTQTLRFYRQSARPTQEEMQRVLDSVAQLFERRLQDAGVRLECRYRSTQPSMVFAGELRQVVANLVGNALDAISPRGRILLREHTATDWPTGRRGTRITVADTGHGMSPETVQRIFEPFFSTKTDTGTGLGLWVSKEIVEKHGGWIRVRSCQRSKLSGTVFSLFLPHIPASSVELLTSHSFSSPVIN